MSGRRAGLGAVAFTVLAVGVLLLMVMFAARSGPERIFAGPLHDPDIRPAHPSYSFRTLPGARPPRRDQPIPHNAFFTTMGWLVRIAFLVCVLWLVYRLIRYVVERMREYRAHPAKPEKPEPVDFDVLDDPEPLVEEIAKDADAQFALLMGGEPRNAIVACWDRFEEQAERAHAARKDWETSSEFTLRLLEAVSADAAAVTRLEQLYREARFSAHEMGEPRREEAVEALRAIHVSLGIGARAR